MNENLHLSITDLMAKLETKGVSLNVEKKNRAMHIGLKEEGMVVRYKEERGVKQCKITHI